MNYKILSLIFLSIFLIGIVSATTYTRTPNNMVSSTSPSPFVVTESSDGGSPAWQAFRISTGTQRGWESNNFPSSDPTPNLAIDLGSGNNGAFNGINYTTLGGDCGASCLPKSITIFVSNDGSSWTNLTSNSSVATFNGGYLGSWNWTNSNSYRFWNVTVTANNGGAVVWIENLTLYSGSIVATTLNVNLTNPINNIATSNTSINFTANYTQTGTNLYNLTNGTTTIWYQNNNSIFNQTTQTITGTQNVTGIVISGFPIGNFIWNSQGCWNNSGTYNCTSQATNNTFSIVNFQSFNITMNNATYETKSESFSYLFNSSTTPTNPSFFYNSTQYTATLTNLGGNNYTLSSTIDVPTGSGVNNLYFAWLSNGTNISGTTYTQTIGSLTLAFCQSSPAYINFTAQDETNTSMINWYVPTFVSNYWLGSGTVVKTLSYSNTTNASSWSFCLTPQNLTLNMQYNISAQASGYPQRSFQSNGTLTLTNTTTNKILYLLPSIDGLYVTFQVLNAGGQQLSNVYVTAVANGLTVGSGYTGSDGGITFWLNPNTQHTFTFVKNGYSTFTTQITPTQSTYTVTMGSTTTTQIIDYTRGVIYSILPNPNVYLNNNSLYNFSFTMNSSYWSLDSFSIIVYANDGTILGTNTSSLSLGTINITANTSNYTYIGMNYSYVVNGTATNLSVIYNVYNENADNGWSILTFITDAKNYIIQGIFGTDASAVSLIIFLFIFAGVGFMTYRFGISSPAVISGIIFALVYFFDVALGFDSYINPIGAVTYFPTVFVGLIMIGYIFKEVTT